MDHFALQTDSLWQASLNGKLHRNFMGYISKKVTPLLGFGVSSIGDSWYSFAQNEKLLETYQNRVRSGEIPIHRGHLLNEEDLVIRRHILNLMTRFETDWSKPEDYTESLNGIENQLREFYLDGLIELGDHKIKVKNQGRPFLRNICMAFDVRLKRKAPGTPLFSKTI
jgi:oxygen-independent coproporphyrinogen-3 oxidase